MNKFKKIAENLIKIKLWRSKAILTQQSQRKSQYGKVIFIPEFSKEVNCVKKDLNKIIQNNFFNYDTEFIIASNQLKDFDLNNGHFSITYNQKKYEVIDMYSHGTLNNQDCLVSFLVKR